MTTIIYQTPNNQQLLPNLMTVDLGYLDVAGSKKLRFCLIHRNGNSGIRLSVKIVKANINGQALI